MARHSRRLPSGGQSGHDSGARGDHRAQIDQAHLARQTHHLHEQVRELLEVQRTEVPNRAVLGKVACRQHPQLALRKQNEQLASTPD